MAWRMAWRDLHPRLRGLRLLFLCLFLGVATLAGIGSLTSALTSEIGARGRTLLGGDIEIAMSQRQMAAAERTAVARLGQLSETVRMRAMARPLPSGSAGAPIGEPVLTEFKGVDDAYPLYGRLDLVKGTYRPLAADQILIAPSLAERMRLRVGDRLRYGKADFTITGIIAQEPDRVGEGFTLGPVAIASMAGIERSGLVQPGSLMRAKYRLRLPEGSDPAALREQLEQRFADQGWDIRDRERAAPGASRFIERMGQFLTLIGITGLVIAGIGVGNGVAAYLTLKRSSLATFKILGATSQDIVRIYMVQLGIVSLLAVALGLVAGALAPVAVVALAGDALPVQPGFSLHPRPLLTSAMFGLLIALIFALPPLARARRTPAATLLRAQVEPDARLGRGTLMLIAGAAANIIAILLAGARDPLFSAGVLGAIAAMLLILLLIGRAVVALARRLPRPQRPLLRLALANLHRPGAHTGSLIMALGLSLTLFVTLAAIQTSLNSEVERSVPNRAPTLFVLDLPSTAEDMFRTLVVGKAPEAELNIVPSLRGTVVAYGGKRVADMAEKPSGAWILRGERGITFSDELPQGSQLVAGQWWPRNYDGPPLLSLDADQAKALGVVVGDTMTVSVLGREIDARVASLRRLDWDGMGFNYVLLFSPNALAGAPYRLTATIRVKPENESRVTRALVSAFPESSVIAVGEVIEQVSRLLGQMATAIFAAASITIAAGMAVLVGAILAARQSRAYDSLLLKMMGATRRQILLVQALEYGLLAALLGSIALIIGVSSAYFVIVHLFEFGWAPDWFAVLGTLALGIVGTLAVALAASLPLLSVRPARALRQL